MAEEWYEGAHFFRRASLSFADCDCRQRASLYTIMKLLSEIAGEDYEGRGLGRSFLMERGQVLLLSRLSLCFLRTPVYRENIVAETWERTLNGPYICRDYEIKDENKQLLIAGKSQWFAADPLSREILRPSALPVCNREMDKHESACQDCKKLSNLEDIPVIGCRKIYYSDLDSNGHVNNAVYGKIAVDFLPEEFRQRELKAFSINFNLETRERETLEIHGTNKENGYIIQGASAGRKHFSCELEY